MLGLFLLALLAFALPLVLLRYLGRLPDAPSCPECRFLTLALQDRAGWGALPLLATTSLRECARCGWRGRMRWRWARSRASDEE